jgi:hypothetical protein
MNYISLRRRKLPEPPSVTLLSIRNIDLRFAMDLLFSERTWRAVIRKARRQAIGRYEHIAKEGQRNSDLDRWIDPC